MKDLLECKDLRNNKRVKTAYWGMKEYPAIIREIPPHLSLADIAFEMRDACQISAYYKMLKKIWMYTSRTCLFTDWLVYRCTAKYMIIAATLAWEQRIAPTDESARAGKG